MLDLADFYHLPELDPIIERLARDDAGLVVVAGLDPRPHIAHSGGAPAASAPPRFLPGGRPTLFRILARRLLEVRLAAEERRGCAALVAEGKDAVHLPRRLAQHVFFARVNAAHSYQRRLQALHGAAPGLLLLERIEPAWAPLALDLAAGGWRVLTQLDTALRGADVVEALTPARPDGAGANARVVCWVVSVQRVPTLCPECKTPGALLEAEAAALRWRFPDLPLPQGPFYRGAGCSACGGSGRRGDVSAYDVYCTGAEERALLPLERYLYGLISAGKLPPGDLLRLESEQLHQTYHLLASSERALAEANRDLQRRVTELEAAQRVLARRTEALVSLQTVTQSVVGATLHASPGDIAHLVCRHAVALSGADRAVLYGWGDAVAHFSDDQKGERQAQILAAHGWPPGQLPAEVPLDAFSDLPAAATPFSGAPPGVRAALAVGLRSGMLLPLVAGSATAGSAGPATPLQPVGALFVQSSRRGRFEPDEVACLETVAAQAALALQRAGLIFQLRQKVAALERAHVALAQKERMEQELELAREMQMRMLPPAAPDISGYTFAMRYVPARRVGGDLFDVIPLDEDHFAVAIADVSDKGVPAALYMALTRSLLWAEARRLDGMPCAPAVVLARVNDLLLKLAGPEMFVTLFYGVVDRRVRCLTYARAGHDQPFLLRPRAGDRVHVAERESAVGERRRGEMGATGCWQLHLLDAPGMALGLFPSARLNLREQMLSLIPGDRLVLYTDGLTDARAPEGELYGRRRLQHVLRTAAASAPAALCDAVFGAVAAFQAGAEQYDDMTMLVVGVEGSGER